ncbi:hypothetical protein NX722_07895 [Endozoicomonas gorgoniicola]|uniref:Mor transcription activator domain-containing protein n=1 Tax=Endozoicomonas gorgoniicola TaxID=1234144 RepID=A0ABT3MT59_9GAMM|nr:Mor transcription activator family protein [Endozoicomonas gorgoniicola]MCW7552571.1 hypothetical protein [Endozoicomonas gorgoniicola]
MEDLFGIDSENNDIMAHLDDDVLHQKDYWPGELVTLAEAIRTQMRREGEQEDATYKQMERVLLAMSFLCGGRNYYLPNGDRIKRALRNKRIYDSFTGHNHRELCQQFRLSEQKIYEIIKEQRQLHQNRIQHNLFTNGQA